MNDDLEDATGGLGKGMHFRMTGDIRLSQPIEVNVKGAKFTNEGQAVLRGTFDGGGHTLSNVCVLYKDKPVMCDTWNKQSWIPLFARNEGTISNLTVVLAQAPVQLDGLMSAGLVDVNLGTIRGCAVSADLTIPSSSSGFGGIVRANAGTIQASGMKGSITLNGNGSAGGIATQNYWKPDGKLTAGTITGCNTDLTLRVNSEKLDNINTTVIRAGGIAGSNGAGTISDCRAKVDFQVNATGNTRNWNHDGAYYTIQMGGVAGQNGHQSGSSIEGCTASGSISCSAPADAKVSLGGVVGNKSNGSRVSGSSGSVAISKGSASGGSSTGPVGTPLPSPSGAGTQSRPDCIICNNSGRMPCPRCKGKGTIRTGDFGIGGGVKPSAGGLGYTDGGIVDKPCDYRGCNGNGWIPCPCGRSPY